MQIQSLHLTNYYRSFPFLLIIPGWVLCFCHANHAAPRHVTTRHAAPLARVWAKGGKMGDPNYFCYEEWSKLFTELSAVVASRNEVCRHSLLSLLLYIGVGRGPSGSSIEGRFCCAALLCHALGDRKIEKKSKKKKECKEKGRKNRNKKTNK